MVTRLDFQNANYTWLYSAWNFPRASVPIFANFGDDIVFGNSVAACKGVHLVHVKHAKVINDALSYRKALRTLTGKLLLESFVGTPPWLSL